MLINKKNRYALSKLNIKKIIKPNIRKTIMKPNIRKAIMKPNIRKAIMKPIIKPIIKPFIKPNVKKPFIKPNIKKLIMKYNVKKPILKPNVKKPILKLNVKKPTIKPNIKKPIIKQLIKPIRKPIIKPIVKPIVKPIIKLNISKSFIRSNIRNKTTNEKLNILLNEKNEMLDISEMPIESVNLVNGKRKYIVLLISGEIRTFIFKEQIDFFKRLINYLYLHFENVHVYLLLKIPRSDKTIYIHRRDNLFICSQQGLENLNELLSILKPIYNSYFYDFNLNTNANYSQMKMIDILIKKATYYEKINNIKYDMFFRIRPDSCILINELKIDTLIENYIYTSIKNDAIGSDQIFLFNQNILKFWWSYIRKLCDTNRMVNMPDYTIFNMHISIVQQKFQNWLVRTYNQEDTWNWKEERPSLSSEYLWQYEDNYNKLLIKIPHKIFLQQLIENIKIYGGMFKSYLYE
jgi:hypothetical protein